MSLIILTSKLSHTKNSMVFSVLNELKLFFSLIFQCHHYFNLSPINLTLSVSVISVKPEKGDALLFFSLHLDATTDANSLHGSCPVIEGEKWSATKWIHVSDFEKPVISVEGGDCVDDNENCSRWAKIGECEKNPLYMVGSAGVRGKCMKSCNVCSS